MNGCTNSWYQSYRFSATIHIESEANVSVTAVNPAGNQYTGTTNSSGVLNLTVKYPGTYTVTGTKGTDTASAVVEAFDNGQTYNVAVVFEDILFDSTTNAFGTFLYGGGPTVVTVGNDTLTVEGQQSGAYYPAYSDNKIDLTNATQLKFTGTFEQLGYNLELGFCDTRPQAYAGPYKTGDLIRVTNGYLTLSSNQTFSDSVVLDVSSCTGEHYFYFSTSGNDGSSSTIVNTLVLTKVALKKNPT